MATFLGTGKRPLTRLAKRFDLRSGRNTHLGGGNSSNTFRETSHGLGRRARSAMPQVATGAGLRNREALLPMHRDAATVAEMLVTRDKRWLKPVAHGLARCSPDDPRIVAALVALARQERDWSGEPEACDMLGVLAESGRPCKKALIQMFLSPDLANRSLAERALWNMSRYAPESVAKAVRIRVRRELRLLVEGDKEDRKRVRLAHALRPLRNPDSKLAASRVRRVLAELETIASHGSPKRALIPANGWRMLWRTVC